MSHFVKITIIANQEIELLGKTVNIYNLESINLDSEGKIIDYSLEKKVKEANNEQN